MAVLLERSIPTKEINEAARKEKLGRPPISELHYWWTRKPLVVSRAVILAAISEKLDVENWKKLVGINAQIKNGKPIFYLKPWQHPRFSGYFEELKREARQLYGDDLLIYDPFAGSGMIPFEALRLQKPVQLPHIFDCFWALEIRGLRIKYQL